MGRPTSSAATPRDRWIIGLCVVLITFLVWVYLVNMSQHSSSQAGPDAITQMGMTMSRRWTPRDFFFAFVMWAVMMIGMMTPSAAPALVLLAKLKAGRNDTDVAFPVAVFGLGYLVVWIGFSAIAALAQWVLHESTLLSPSMVMTNRMLAGATLIAAGVYQLSPAKNACLTQCQRPVDFLLANWRDGRVGSFSMGTRHGIYCVGCCWALMAVLFVVGVMNLAWVAGLAAFVLVEKFGRTGLVAARAGGAIMIAFGILVLAHGQTY